MAEFDKFLDNHSGNITVAVIAYGGISMTYDGLTEQQKLVFLDNIMLMSKTDSKVLQAMTEGMDSGDMEYVYCMTVHKTALRYPRFVAVHNEKGQVYAAPIVDVTTTMHIIQGLAKETIYLYKEDDVYELRRAIMIHNVANGKRLYSDMPKIGAIECITSESYMFDSFDEYCAFLPNSGELYMNVHDMLINHLPRLEASMVAKAETLYNLAKLV